uniref:Protein kinase domain-containing protein n=1 Tax=Meloidogyne hapla TaxID=6305 RepID=A0A1I8B581_MELHA
MNFDNINLALLVFALLQLLMLLPAASWIHCLNRKKKKKGKDKAKEDKAAKLDEKKVHGFIPKVEAIPKKVLGLEPKVAAKVEKKPEDGKGHSPKDDKPLQAKEVEVKKAAEPEAKGKDAAKRGCGVVYKVKATNGDHYAMKLESMEQKRQDQLLPLEAHILKRLQFSAYAAKFIAYGKCRGGRFILEKSFRVLVMALLGKSIGDLQDQRPKFKFTTGTVLRIGVQALRGIAFLHSIYYVHRDVKPANFAVDRENPRRVYLIDFGLSRSLRKRGTKFLRKSRVDVPFRGTPGYCSLNAHKRVELGRHDDIWSLIYMLVDLNNGSLPWFGQDTRDKTALLKEYLIENEYMHACPIAFRSIMDYLRTLTYKQRPDYCGIELAFIQMMEAREIQIDEPMDWEPAYIKRPGETTKPKAKRNGQKGEIENTQESVVSQNAKTESLYGILPENL